MPTTLNLLDDDTDNQPDGNLLAGLPAGPVPPLAVLPLEKKVLPQPATVNLLAPDLVIKTPPFSLLDAPPDLATMPVIPPIPVKPPVTYRTFGDPIGTRQAIYAKTLAKLQKLEPVSTPLHTLRLQDVDWADPETVPLTEQKKALLTGGTLNRRMRGTWILEDNKTGQEVARKTTQIAKVPILTDRGTFISSGNEMSLASQLRLKPGVYTRQQSNGLISSHFNVNKGPAFKVHMDPETGIFKLGMQQSEMPLFPLMKQMGISEREMRDTWGDEITNVNLRKDDPQVVGKLYNKLVPSNRQAANPEQGKAVIEAFQRMELDPEVSKRTLGEGFVTVDGKTMLAVTKKLLAISRKEVDTDDRDAMAYQTIHGPEDIIAERIGKNRGVLNRMLWKSAKNNQIANGLTNVFDDSLRASLISSGLGQVMEQTNLAEVLDQQSRITKMGDGGIGSLDAVPADSRSVHPSQYGLVDYLKTAESSMVGVDLRAAGGAFKGSDNRIYMKVRDKEGNRVFKSAEEVSDSVMAFPGEMESGKAYVTALVNNQLRKVKRESVDFVAPENEHTLGTMSQMVPAKSSLKGQRVAMAARMLTQALPLVSPEAPLVQVADPEDPTTSFEEIYGTKLGAIKADKAGKVMSITPDHMRIRHDDGTESNLELMSNLPTNRKTFIHQTPVLKAGDIFKPGQLLVKSNTTNDAGAVALGINVRTAYIPWEGMSFEDAMVISESMAKRLGSEQMYKHDYEWSDRDRKGKSAFVGIFPGKHTRDTLDKFDDDGIIKPGTIVKTGDPIILVASELERNKKSLVRGDKPAFKDKSVVWDHSYDGVVTDIAGTASGNTAVVKSVAPTVLADKLCFDPETTVLTRDRDYVPVAEVTLQDWVATLNARDELEWQQPTHVWEYDHTGDMYSLQTKQLDMLVTMDHKLWVAEPGKTYGPVTARDFYAAEGEWRFKKDCKWVGEYQARYVFPAVYAVSPPGNSLAWIDMATWLEFLGYYIAQGRVHPKKGYVYISQFRSSKAFNRIVRCLDRLNLPYSYSDADRRFIFSNIWLAELLRPLGDAYSKCVPTYVQDLAPEQIRVFFDAYMAGDGHKDASWEFGTSSPQLMRDLRMLCMKLGYSTSVSESDRTDNWQKETHWRARVNRKHLRPWWKKSRVKTCTSVTEEIVQYSGKVHCITVPNHTIYVERRNKSYWSQNSGRYG